MELGAGPGKLQTTKFPASCIARGFPGLLVPPSGPSALPTPTVVVVVLGSGSSPQSSSSHRRSRSGRPPAARRSVKSWTLGQVQVIPFVYSFLHRFCRLLSFAATQTVLGVGARRAPGPTGQCSPQGEACSEQLFRCGILGWSTPGPRRFGSKLRSWERAGSPCVRHTLPSRGLPCL